MANKLKFKPFLGFIFTIIVYFIFRTFMFKNENNSYKKSKIDNLYYWVNEERNMMIELDKNSTQGYVLAKKSFEINYKIISDSIIISTKNNTKYAKGKFDFFSNDSLLLKINHERLTFIKEH